MSKVQRYNPLFKCYVESKVSPSINKALTDIEQVLRQFRLEPQRTDDNKQINVSGITFGRLVNKLKNHGWNLVQTLPDKEDKTADMVWGDYRVSVTQAMTPSKSTPIGLRVEDVGNQGLGQSSSIRTRDRSGKNFVFLNDPNRRE